MALEVSNLPSYIELDKGSRLSKFPLHFQINLIFKNYVHLDVLNVSSKIVLSSS